MKRLTTKEAKLVTLKAKGKTHREAGREAYNAPPLTKDSTVIANTQKVLNRPHVKDALEKALLKHDITLDNALLPIAKGLKAKRIVEVEGDFIETEIEDLGLQLKASDRALKLMGVTDKDNPTLHFHQHIHKQGKAYDL